MSSPAPRLALITGATAGIGEATAHLLAREGWRLILTGRRAERLTALSHTLQQSYQTECLTLAFDVRDRAAVEAALGQLPAAWQAIDDLVNNAGLAAGLATVDAGLVDDWERMIDTNLKGLLYVSRVILPGMRERRRGHVVNLGSIAGKEAYPNGAVYCATKHAIEAVSKGMRQDLLTAGVKVTNVCPGAVDTEFSLVRFHGDEQKAQAVYRGFAPLLAEDVADVIHFALTRPPHVNLNDVLVMPTAQASATQFDRSGNTSSREN